MNIIAVLDQISPGQDSVVFGLVGPWGSGKSRVLADVQGSLTGDWKAVQITPWAASDSTALQLDFLRALASTFPTAANHKIDAKGMLEKYSNYFTPLLGMIPVAGQAVKGITQEALNAITKQKPWHDTFDDLAKDLRSSGRRVLGDAADREEVAGL
ncbi:hypothetical protein IAE22_30745, partial [Bacillus sp. S34]|nr:hypothetical protein [Bacillus sp. S34]